MKNISQTGKHDKIQEMSIRKRKSNSTDFHLLRNFSQGKCIEENTNHELILSDVGKDFQQRVHLDSSARQKEQ